MRSIYSYLFTNKLCCIIISLLFYNDQISAQWCTGGCTIGTGFNNIANAGTLTPTTSRQTASYTTNFSNNHKVYYTFTATAGRTYVFDFCDMLRLNGLTSNRIYIYNGVCAS